MVTIAATPASLGSCITLNLPKAINALMWDEIIRRVLSLSPHVEITVKAPHPSSFGFKRTLGSPKGQKGDWELMLADGRRIHVREYEGFYKVHWDFVSPSASIRGHLEKDAPEWKAIYDCMLLLLKRFLRRS